MRNIALLLGLGRAKYTGHEIGTGLGNILFPYHIRQFALPIVPDATIVGHSRGNILDASPRDGIACVGLYELLSGSLILLGRYVCILRLRIILCCLFLSLGIYNLSRLCVTVKLAET